MADEDKSGQSGSFAPPEQGGAALLRRPDQTLDTDPDLRAAPEPGKAAALPHQPMTSARKPLKSLANGGSWRLAGIKGTPADVIEKINGAAFVPDTAKANLVAEIETHHLRAEFIVVHAHFSVHKTQKGVKTTRHTDISEL